MVLTSWTTMNPSSYKGQLSWPVHRHHRRHHHRRHPQLLPRNPRNKVDGDNALLSFTQLPGLVFYLTNTQLRDIKSNILLFFLKLKNMYWKTACFTTTTCHHAILTASIPISFSCTYPMLTRQRVWPIPSSPDRSPISWLFRTKDLNLCWSKTERCDGVCP